MGGKGPSRRASCRRLHIEGQRPGSEYRDFLYSLPGSQSVHPNTTPTNTGNCGSRLCGEAGPGPPGHARCWCWCQATPSPNREPCTLLPAQPGANQGLPGWSWLMPASQVPKGFGGGQGLIAGPAPWGKPGLGHPRNQGWVGAGLELLYNRADLRPVHGSRWLEGQRA